MPKAIIKDPNQLNVVEAFSQRNTRLHIFYAVFGALFITLFVGLAWRQLIFQNKYRILEEKQNQRRILQPGPRGQIFDRNGELLVGNRPRFSAVIYLNELKSEFKTAYYDRVRTLREEHEASPEANERFRFDWEDVQWESRLSILQSYLRQIDKILDIQSEISMKDLKNHFGFRLLMPFPLIKDLSPENYAQLIEQLPLGSPIQIYTDTAREYPHKNTAAHVLGYVSSRDDIPEEDVPGKALKTFSYKGKKGISGLERQFEEQIRGTTGGEIWLVDRFQFQHERIINQVPEPGQDLRTSLQLDLQVAAENAIGNKTGAAIAVEVNTGEILVLASKPDYDPNRLSPFISHKVNREINERGAWLNRATQGLYPPGSTFKMITAIAGMRNGVIDPYEKLTCGPYWKVGSRNFPEHSGASFGRVDLLKALEKSSNVYFYQTGIGMGADAIAEEAIRFGLNRPTGIEIPFEERKRMLVPTKDWKKNKAALANRGGWVPGDTANMAIGQGFLLVTPIQMARFAASLARNATDTQLSILHDTARNAQRQPNAPTGLTPRQYDAVVQGMERAVSLSGTARFAMVPGVRIAGKTGTAQVMSNGRPLTIAWFLGFAPVENPKIAVVVTVEGIESDDNYAGGKTAAPIARSILETYFSPQNSALSSL